MDTGTPAPAAAEGSTEGAARPPRTAPTMPEVTAARVARLRMLLQLTQDELAQIVGSNRHSVMRWEAAEGELAVTPAARRLLGAALYQLDQCEDEMARRRLMVYLRRALELGGEVAAYALLHLTYRGMLPRLGRSIESACGVEDRHADLEEIHALRHDGGRGAGGGSRPSSRNKRGAQDRRSGAQGRR